MNWNNHILDNINEFGKDKITLTEKLYLDNYSTSKKGHYESQLNIRYNYYTELYSYDGKKYYINLRHIQDLLN